MEREGRNIPVVAPRCHTFQWRTNCHDFANLPCRGGAIAQKLATATVVLLTPKDAARMLKVSLSWLAKARMRGDGPPYIKVGRSIRYAEAALIQWMKSKQRSSTSEQ